MTEKQSTTNPEENQDHVIMPTALTAENGAKNIFSGEFYQEVKIICATCFHDDENEDCEMCGGDGYCFQRVAVTWSTIKDIYEMAVANLSTPILK